MSPEQAALVIRVSAALVWLAYLIRTARSDLRVPEAIVVIVICAYAGAQAYRAIVAPTALVLEFTVISGVALIAGLALLTAPRR